jgi:hypothetical protein
MSEEPGRNRAVQLINSVVAGMVLANGIDLLWKTGGDGQSDYAATFLRNDEPDFQLAQFPLHHPGYPVA